MEHYFTKDPKVVSKRRELSYKFLNKEYFFISDNGVFSKEHVDTGTEILIKNFINYNQKKEFSLLDFGCGYGVVGIIVNKNFIDSKITYADINERALELTKENIELNKVKEAKDIIQTDLFSNIKEKYDVILSNPPIRAGKKTIFEIYNKSYEHLNENGSLYVVIMTKHGAKSTEKKLMEIYSEVKCISKEKGYRVYRAVK